MNYKKTNDDKTKQPVKREKYIKKNISYLAKVFMTLQVFFHMLWNREPHCFILLLGLRPTQNKFILVKSEKSKTCFIWMEFWKVWCEFLFSPSESLLFCTTFHYGCKIF